MKWAGSWKDRSNYQPTGNFDGAKLIICIRIVEHGRHAFGYDIGKKITSFAADVLLCKDRGGYLKEMISFISNYAGAC